MKKTIVTFILLIVFGSFVMAEAPDWASYPPEADETYSYYVGYGSSSEGAVENALERKIKMLSFSVTEALYGINGENDTKVPIEILDSEILDDLHAAIPLAMEMLRVVLEEYSEEGSYYALVGIPEKSMDEFWDEITDFLDYSYDDVAQNYETPAPDVTEEPAQEETPAWVLQPPAPDDSFFYAVGSARNPRLLLAQTQAQADALNKAVLLAASKVETEIRELVGEDPYVDEIVSEIVTRTTADMTISNYSFVDAFIDEDGTVYILAAVPLVYLEKHLDNSRDLVAELMK